MSKSQMQVSGAYVDAYSGAASSQTTTNMPLFQACMPFAKSQPMEAYEPGKCPECGEPIQMHLKRAQQPQ